MFDQITNAIKQLQPELSQIKNLLEINNKLLQQLLEKQPPLC